MTGIWSTLVKLMLPTRCVLCSTVGLENVCAACAAKLQAVGPCCLRCGRRRLTPYASPDCGECHNQKLGVSTARSMFLYNAAGRELLADFKFNRREAAGDWLAQRLADYSSGLYWPHPSPPAQLVIPVPIHRKRLQERGFNQAAVLGEAVARRLGMQHEASVLLRVRPTPTQVGLTPQQRSLNVRGAFAFAEQRRLKVAGRCVLLVDDLMTTGATLKACALELKRAGALAVLGLTAFSTVRDIEAPDWDVPPPLR